MNVCFKHVLHQSLSKSSRTSQCQTKSTLSHISLLSTIHTININKIHTPTKYTINNTHSHHTNHHLNLIYFDITKSFTTNNTPPESQSPTNNISSDTDSTPSDSINKPSKSDDKIDRRAYPIAFSSLLMGIGIGVILPVMPQFANEIGINTMQYGLVISVMGVTRLLMNVPAGLITDKFGRKSTLVGGPVISALGTLIIATAQNLNEMIMSRFITGAGGSLQMAGAQAYLSDISTIKNRARTMAPLMIGFSSGAALGPFIGGFLCDYYQSVRIPFFFVATAIGTVALNNMIMLPETLKKENRKQDVNTKQLLTKMFSEWKYLLKNNSHISGVAVHMCFWFAQAGATFTLMPLFATNELGVSATQIGGIFAMMSIVNICGAQLFAKISDKFGRKKMIVPAVCIVASVIPLIPHVGNINELYYLMFAYSIGSTMLGTSPTAYIADIHSGSKEKDERRSQALAMLRSGGDCGLMIGSGLLGYLTHTTGSFMLPMCTASIVLFGAGTNFAINAKETVNVHKTKE